MSIISVEFSHTNSQGQKSYGELHLPASQAAYRDAMEKARITGSQSITSYEIIECKYDWLLPYLPENAKLLELNLLAMRIENYIQEDMDIFEAMVRIEAKRGKNKSIPLPRFINLTFNTENCHVAGGIKNDTQLGRFLYENNMLYDEDAAAVKKRSDEGRPVSDIYAMLGKEHRENEGGIFTATGRYVEFDGTVKNEYTPGKMFCLADSSGPVVLRITKGSPNDTGAGNPLSAKLTLPPTRIDEIDRTLDSVGAASLEEVGYSCTGCLIPAAKEWIDEAQNISSVGHFARELSYMEQDGSLLVYKALLEATECESLESALRLVDEIENYTLNADCLGPEEYAREAIRAFSSQCGVELSRYMNLYSFGAALMTHNNIKDTSYGLLSRKDGGPVLSQEDSPAMGMEMR